MCHLVLMLRNIETLDNLRTRLHFKFRFVVVSPDHEMQMADANMVQNAVQPQENSDNKENEWEPNENDENCNDVEFEALNAQLDQLNSALDSLEQKNDNIHAELIELLKSNREARKQFQESQEEQRSQLQKTDH